MTGSPEDLKGTKSYEKSSLLDVSLKSDVLKPITGDVQVDVLTDKNIVTKDGSLKQNGLAIADLTDSQLLGDTHAGVLENKEVKAKNYTQTYSALAVVDADATIVGDAHAGVLEKEKVETDSYTWEHSGVVIVDTKGTPIVGDLHAGVLEDENYAPKNNGENPVDPTNQ